MYWNKFLNTIGVRAQDRLVLSCTSITLFSIMFETEPFMNMFGYSSLKVGSGSFLSKQTESKRGNRARYKRVGFVNL